MHLIEVKEQYIVTYTQYYHLLAPPVDDTAVDTLEEEEEEEVVGSDVMCGKLLSE